MSTLTLSQQRRATNLLRRGLVIKEAFDNGDAVSAETDDAHTRDMRVFLIETGAIRDRRKATRVRDAGIELQKVMGCGAEPRNETGDGASVAQSSEASSANACRPAIDCGKDAPRPARGLPEGTGEVELGSTPPSRSSAQLDEAVRVCPDCDIAGCRHLRTPPAEPSEDEFLAALQSTINNHWETSMSTPEIARRIRAALTAAGFTLKKVA